MTNNVFILAENEPVAKYSKAVIYNISGMRLDLEGKPISFLLQTKVPGQFVYEDEVVELYSKKEQHYFVTANKHLFNNGLLKPYAESREETDFSQVYSDEDIAKVVALRTVPAITSRVKDIKSVAVLNRILAHAEEIGLSQRAMEIIRKRIQALAE